VAHYNLGTALYAKGQVDEAMQHYRRAIALDPKYAAAHNNLGLALKAKGQLDEAIAAFRRAIALDPKLAVAHNNLGTALYAKGQVDEAIAAFRQAIKLDPKYANAHNNLGNALYDKGQVDEAIQAFRQAIKLDPKHALAHGALGQALLKQARFVEAHAAMRRCLELLPHNHSLRKPFSKLLRQYERFPALDEKLPAFLQGDATPADAAERLALAQLCRHKKLYAASARFYTEAFADQPRPAQDPEEWYRYGAACAAALAAAGQGKDAAKLSDKERACLRRQALDWLHADLAAWTTVLEKAPPQDRLRVQRALQHWQKDLDLAGLRDKEALAKLPEAERTAWRELWADVEHTLVKARGNKPQDKSNTKE
jgi:tetratricopeptide (TPR) repeat protein